MTAGLLGPAVGVGASVVGLVIAQVTGTGGGGSEWVEFGAIGVLGMSFVALVTALTQGKLVTSDVTKLLEAGTKREAELEKLLEASTRREDDGARREQLLLELLGARHVGRNNQPG